MNPIVSIAATGLATAMQQMQRSAADIAGSSVTVLEGREASAPLAAVVAAINAETAFMANATVIRRSDEMLGSLLDVFA